MGLINFDTQLTLSLYHWGSRNESVQHAFLFIANAFVYVLPLVLLWLFFRSRQDRINSAKIFLTAVLAWQVFTRLIGGWLYSAYGFRDRPFSLGGLQELFFERPQKSFPSDHAAVMFAAMLALFAYKYPRLGWLFLIGALVSSFARVVVGFHYVGDILGGFALGAVAYGVIRLLDRPIDRILEKIFHAPKTIT